MESPTAGGQLARAASKQALCYDGQEKRRCLYKTKQQHPGIALSESETQYLVISYSIPPPSRSICRETPETHELWYSAGDRSYVAWRILCLITALSIGHGRSKRTRQPRSALACRSQKRRVKKAPNPNFAGALSLACSCFWAKP